MRGKISITVTLTAMLAAAAGALCVIYAVPAAVPIGLEQASQPSIVKVSTEEFTDERTVEVSFETSPEQSLTARASGVVSASSCKVGTQVHSGDSLLTVESMALIALHTDTPIYREMGDGTTGKDVLALQHELQRLGYHVETTGIFGWRTRKAVNEMLARADGAKHQGGLTPDQIIWIPETTVIPSKCTATVNTMLSDGTEVISVGGQLTALTYTTPTHLIEGTRSFTMFAKTYEIGPAEDHISDRRFLESISATPEYVTYQEQEGKKPTATIALKNTMNPMKVPPSAIFGQRDTTACIQRDDSIVIPVTIIGSALGATLVTPDDDTVRITKVRIMQSGSAPACPEH